MQWCYSVVSGQGLSKKGVDCPKHPALLSILPVSLQTADRGGVGKYCRNLRTSKCFPRAAPSRLCAKLACRRSPLIFGPQIGCSQKYRLQFAKCARLHSQESPLNGLSMQMTSTLTSSSHRRTRSSLPLRLPLDARKRARRRAP